MPKLQALRAECLDFQYCVCPSHHCTARRSQALIGIFHYVGELDGFLKELGI
jgi:hypothetical protein